VLLTHSWGHDGRPHCLCGRFNGSSMKECGYCAGSRSRDGLGGSYPWTVQVEYQPTDVAGWATLSAASGPSLPADVLVSLGALPDRLTHTAALRVKAPQTQTLVSLLYRTP
jgi:hypothetical protein